MLRNSYGGSKWGDLGDQGCDLEFRRGPESAVQQQALRHYTACFDKA